MSPVHAHWYFSYGSKCIRLKMSKLHAPRCPSLAYMLQTYCVTHNCNSLSAHPTLFYQSCTHTHNMNLQHTHTTHTTHLHNNTYIATHTTHTYIHTHTHAHTTTHNLRNYVSKLTDALDSV